MRHVILGSLKKLGWLSDIHLEFLDQPTLERFVADLSATPVDGWLIGGDIGTADTLIPFLGLLENRLKARLYFVLGNHDFYGGSIPEVREKVERHVRASQNLVWLTDASPQVISDTVVLVGEDSWGDARFGDAYGTTVEITDFSVIHELKWLPRMEIVRVLNDLGDSAAGRLEPKLEQAARLRKKVVILTHVPPFIEASWHEGVPSTDEWLPWFACRAVGEVMLRCARKHPETEFLVLCGHTHGEGRCTPAPNLVVLTAGAEYGAPKVQSILELA